MTANQESLKSIDDRHIIKPRVTEFKIRYYIDRYADVSYYREDIDNPDKQDSNWRKYKRKAEQRLKGYNNGEWWIVTVVAEAHYIIPKVLNGIDAECEPITDSLGGVESDGDLEYLQEIENQVLDEVKRECDRLGIYYDDKTPVNINRETEFDA